MDFFSWHSYDSVPSTGMFAAYARHRLDAEGFTETETTCDEWNCNPTLRGTRMHAALCTAMFAELQHAPVDSAMFYDGRCGVSMFSSLFNPLTEAPFPAYYAFLAFNVLYRLGQEVAVYTEQMGEAGQADAAQIAVTGIGDVRGIDIEPADAFFPRQTAVKQEIGFVVAHLRNGSVARRRIVRIAAVAVVNRSGQRQRHAAQETHFDFMKSMALRATTSVLRSVVM